MASTAIGAMQVPVIQADYMAAEFPTASPLMATGVVTIEPNPPFKNGGGDVFDVPEYLEFSTASVVIPTADEEGTMNPLATSKDTGVICRRETGLAAKDSASLAAGDSVPAEIQRQAVTYWAKDTAKTLYAALGGFFTTAAAGTNFVLDTGAPFTPAVVQSAIGLGAVGDQWPLYRIWIMNSIQYAQALNAGIVQFVDAGAYGERILQSGTIPTILGKQVVVDDVLTTDGGSTQDGTTYLCKPGALFLGFQKDFGVEFQRDASKGGGLDEYWLRAHYMPHPRGGVYAGATSPSNATLALGASWTLATAKTTDPKLIGVVKIKFTNA